MAATAKRPFPARPMTIKLLLLRGAPLLIRPLAIALEGMLVPGQNIMVLAIPVAMLALTLSSIPVHLSYYQSTGGTEPAKAREYASGLTIVITSTFLLLATILTFLDGQMGSLLVSATCIVFLIEKFSDESSRMLEFRKAFRSWFLVQLMRSGWMIVPVGLYLCGADYGVAFLVSAVVVAAVSALVFVNVTGVMFEVGRSGLDIIRRRLIFLAASFLPASYRQIPRIMITRLFPDYAHVYLATAQLAQAAALLFNVRFQIPYRKAIARKTILVQRLRHKVMMRILAGPAIVAPLWLAGGLFVLPHEMPDAWLAALLLPLLIADAVTFAVLAAHMDYLQWMRKEARLLRTYVLNGALMAILLLLLRLLVTGAHVSIFVIIPPFVLLGVAWVLTIARVNFSSPYSRPRLDRNGTYTPPLR